MGIDIPSVLMVAIHMLYNYSCWIRPGGHQAFPRGVLAPLPPCLPARCAIIRWVYPVGNGDTLFLFGRILRPLGI